MALLLLLLLLLALVLLVWWRLASVQLPGGSHGFRVAWYGFGSSSGLVAVL